jgi:hypothetical protein
MPALAELARAERWLVWRNEPDPRDPQRRTKVPYDALRPTQNAKSTDPRTWAPYSAAAAAAGSAQERIDGIGFAATNGPYSFGDLDDCARPEVEQIQALDDLLPEARALVELLDTYTEVTPSGRGVRPILRVGHAGFPQAERCKWEYCGFRVEVYAPYSARYYTLTGRHLGGTPTAIRTDGGQLAELLARLEQARQETRPRSSGSDQATPDQATPDWPEAEFRRAWSIRHRLIDGGMPRFLPPNGQSALVLRALNSSSDKERRAALERLEHAHPHLARSLSDRSLVRRVVMFGLRTYAGYPLPAAAAVMWALFRSDAERRGRGEAWLRAEILRLWGDAQPAKRHENPNIRKMLSQADPGQADQAPEELRTPSAQRSPARRPAARAGRAVDSPASYLEWLGSQASADTVLLSARAVAEALGLSLRTIRRYEASLRASGQIERRALDRRQAGCVVLLAGGRGDTSAAPAVPAAAEDVVIDEAVLPAVVPPINESAREVTRALPGTASVLPAPALPAGGLAAPVVEPPPVELADPPAPPASVEQAAPAAQALGLPELVAEAIEVYGSRLRRVQRYVADNSAGRSYRPEAVAYWYKQELADRRRQRDRARAEAKIRAMNLRQLYAARRSAAAHVGLGGAMEPPEDAPRRRSWELARRSLGYWRWYHERVCLRIVELEPPRRPARAARRTDPPPPELLALFGLAESAEGLPDQSPPAPVVVERPGGRGGHRPACHLPASGALLASRYDASGLPARLRQLAAERVRLGEGLGSPRTAYARGEPGGVAVGDTAALVAELAAEDFACGVLGHVLVAGQEAPQQLLGVQRPERMCVAPGADIDVQRPAGVADLGLHAPHQGAGVVHQPVPPLGQLAQQGRVEDLRYHPVLAALGAADRDAAALVVDVPILEPGDLLNAQASGALDAQDQAGLGADVLHDRVGLLRPESEPGAAAGDRGAEVVGDELGARGEPPQLVEAMLQLTQRGDRRADAAAGVAAALHVGDVGAEVVGLELAQLAEVRAQLGLDPLHSGDDAPAVGRAGAVAVDPAPGLPARFVGVARVADAQQAVQGVVALLDQRASHGRSPPW